MSQIIFQAYVVRSLEASQIQNTYKIVNSRDEKKLIEKCNSVRYKIRPSLFDMCVNLFSI